MCSEKQRSFWIKETTHQKVKKRRSEIIRVVERRHVVERKPIFPVIVPKKEGDHTIVHVLIDVRNVHELWIKAAPCEIDYPAAKWLAWPQRDFTLQELDDGSPQGRPAVRVLILQHRFFVRRHPNRQCGP